MQTPKPTLFQETLFAAMATATKDTTPHMTAAESPEAEDLLANRQIGVIMFVSAK